MKDGHFSEPMGKSCYVLEIEAASGAAPRWLAWALSSRSALERALREDGETCLGAWFLVSYSESVSLHTYQQGKRTQTQDLLPGLKLKIPAYPPLSFDARGRLLARGEPLAKGQELYDKLCEALCNEEISGIRLSIDWNAVPLTPLQGKVLKPGDVLPAVGEELPELYQGLNDLDNGVAYYRDEDGEWAEYE
ncbi:MAG: hypothetical protein ACAI44_05370 [Candidatus Sericytochromatia bacterium]